MKRYALIPLVAAIILFAIGHNGLKADNLREGIWCMALSIILSISASTFIMSLQISELKAEIKKNQSSDSELDGTVA